ncbi:hypothetical protein BCR34DRAFT_631754, partial [Clohesyomyces aquaticus]
HLLVALTAFHVPCLGTSTSSACICTPRLANDMDAGTQGQSSQTPGCLRAAPAAFAAMVFCSALIAAVASGARKCLAAGGLRRGRLPHACEPTHRAAVANFGPRGRRRLNLKWPWNVAEEVEGFVLARDGGNAMPNAAASSGGTIGTTLGGYTGARRRRAIRAQQSVSSQHRAAFRTASDTVCWPSLHSTACLLRTLGSCAVRLSGRVDRGRHPPARLPRDVQISEHVPRCRCPPSLSQPAPSSSSVLGALSRSQPPLPPRPHGLPSTALTRLRSLAGPWFLAQPIAPRLGFSQRGH